MSKTPEYEALPQNYYVNIVIEWLADLSLTEQPSRWPTNRPTLLVFWSHAQFRTGLKFTYGEKGEGVEGSLEFGGRGEERIG